MKVDIKLTWKLFLTYLVCCAHTASVQVTMSAEKAVMGQSGTIHCSADVQTDEINPALEIRSSRSDMLFAWTQADNSSSPHTRAEGNRYTLDVDSSVENTVHLTLNIADLVCEDEDSYICTATVAVLNTTLIVQRSQRVELKVEVPITGPKPLVLSQERAMVKEHDWIDVECRAVVGHTNGTRLLWRLDQGGQVEVVPHRDPRIILQEAHSLSGDGDCLRQVTSRLRLVVTRKHHGCQVSCFVWNPDLQPSMPPHCHHQDRDLCANTSKLQVHYGVSEETMQLYMLPETEVIDGAAINLVCRAEGYPLVNYTWDRSPPLSLSRRVTVSTQDSNASQLLLASFDSKTDSGIYKCTAWNWVMDVELHSASQDIFISSNLAQKHVMLEDTMKKLSQVELVLLGAAMTAIAIFLMTLAVAILTYICCRRRRQQPKPKRSVATKKPDRLPQKKEDSESAGSTESSNVAGTEGSGTGSISEAVAGT